MAVDIPPAVAGWLLEPDGPGPRYLALRDLFPPGAEELAAARRKAHRDGPIATVLANLHPDGYWVQPGAGYGPKYRGSVWSLITLAFLGASVEDDPRILTAARYYLDHALTPAGQFGYDGRPSGTFDCLQGNMCAALKTLGVEDERLDAAFDWLARTVTGEGIAPAGAKDEPRRWYQFQCGPDFRCGINDGHLCGWGGVKIMLALGAIPPEKGTPLVERAIHRGAELLLAVDPATAEYPHPFAPAPHRGWWDFGMPVSYVADILQLAEALQQVGYAADPRLASVYDYLRRVRTPDGRWTHEQRYPAATWLTWGRPGRPSKWVTIRALRVLDAAP